MPRREGKVVLFLGGARSGKSRLAQERAEATQEELVYLATAQPHDNEMTERIARHRFERGPRWRTIEAPIGLPEAIGHHDEARRVLLVDCLTLWISNLMMANLDVAVAVSRLLETLNAAQATVLLVANEVGMGIVPENALARRFRDETGRLHQQIAALADEVWFVAAGLSIAMKSP